MLCSYSTVTCFERAKQAMESKSGKMCVPMMECMKTVFNLVMSLLIPGIHGNPLKPCSSACMPIQAMMVFVMILWVISLVLPVAHGNPYNSVDCSKPGPMCSLECPCYCFLEDGVCVPCSRCNASRPSCWEYICRHAEDSRQAYLRNNPGRPTPTDAATTPQSPSVNHDSKNSPETDNTLQIEMYLILVIVFSVLIFVMGGVLLYCVCKWKCSGKENQLRQTKVEQQSSVPSSPVLESRPLMAGSNVDIENNGESNTVQVETSFVEIDETEQSSQMLRERRSGVTTENDQGRQSAAQPDPAVHIISNSSKQSEHKEKPVSGMVAEESAPSSNDTGLGCTRTSTSDNEERLENNIPGISKNNGEHQSCKGSEMGEMMSVKEKKQTERDRPEEDLDQASPTSSCEIPISQTQTTDEQMTSSNEGKGQMYRSNCEDSYVDKRTGLPEESRTGTIVADAAETSASVNSKLRPQSLQSAGNSRHVEEETSTRVKDLYGNGNIPENPSYALSVNGKYPLSLAYKVGHTGHLQSDTSQDIAHRTGDNGESAPLEGGNQEKCQRSEDPNRDIYKILKRVDWVIGSSSAGDAIEVYVDPAEIHTAPQQLALITGADITKFHVKRYEEPQFDIPL